MIGLMKIRFKLAGIMLIILIIPIIAVYAVYSSKCSKAVTDGQISSLEIINGDRAAYLNEFLEKYIVVQKNFVTDKEVKSFVGNISNNMAEPDELRLLIASIIFLRIISFMKVTIQKQQVKRTFLTLYVKSLIVIILELHSPRNFRTKLKNI